MLTLTRKAGGGEDAMAAIGASTRARKATGQGVNGDLPAELTQARRFGKTRSAQSTALLEDYVELIAQDDIPIEARRHGDRSPLSRRISH